MCERCRNNLGFENQLPDAYIDEVERAHAAQASPVRATGPDFTARLSRINASSFPRLKWVVLMDGSLIISEHSVGQFEVPHSVLAEGDRVRAAGEADIAGSADSGFFGIEISNHSGHYCPCAESLDAARAAFRALRIEFDEVVRIERTIP